MNFVIYGFFMCVVVGVAIAVYRFDQKKQAGRELRRRKTMGPRSSTTPATAPVPLPAPPTAPTPKRMQFEESEYSRLNKQATAFKKAGDMAAAVAALRQAKALCGSQYAETRLAKYLQAAGYFDVAMLEIEWLLDNSEAWAQGMFGHQPASVIECQRTGWLARIHSDAALICKRAKQPDLQAKHQQLYEQHIATSKQLGAISDAHRKAKNAAWEIARQKGPKAMVAFHEKYHQEGLQ